MHIKTLTLQHEDEEEDQVHSTWSSSSAGAPNLAISDSTDAYV